MTRLQLETGFIDLPVGTDFPIDLTFSEISKKGARSGGVSRTLEIEGTENNTTLLGSYFDIDLSNGTFDRNRKTVCSVVQNGVEVFEGYIQLLEVVRVNKSRGTNRKLIKYKVSVFDEVSNFFNEMGDKELTELSFPEHTHIFNRANIIASWSNTSGYTYPQYAKDDTVYTLRDFKPALYEWEYWTKIFASNGYSFTFTEYNALDVQMNKRIIPFNGKAGDATVSQLLSQRYNVRGEETAASYLYDGFTGVLLGLVPPLGILNGASIAAYSAAVGSQMELDTIFEDGENQYNTITNNIINNAGNNRTIQFTTSYDYSIQVRALNSSAVATAFEVDNVEGGQSRLEVKVSLVAQSTTNPNKVTVIDAQQSVITFVGGEMYASGWQSLGSGTNASIASFGLLDASEEYNIHTLVFGQYFNAAGNPGFGVAGLGGIVIKDQASAELLAVEFDVDITNLQFRAISDITELSNGVAVNMDAFIPKKIKQRDLISSISKSYNLVFIPDPDNDRNLIVKTRDKYYSDGAEWDWTYKLDEAQPNTITFLNNEVAQRQVYKYKEDKDPLNTAYQSEFTETYGQTTITLDNEYKTGTDERTLIYSPTPTIISGVGVPMPAINGANPDCNLRVLLHNGATTAPSYIFYDDILPTAGTETFITTYNATSVFDDDVTPNFSILFDAPSALFHSYQLGQTSNYLYNLHHQQELTTINEGERFTGYFDLTESDFQKLSKTLDWKIWIQDNGWFFISKIHAYNSGKRTLTKVDLITADEKTKIKFRKPIAPLPITSIPSTPVLNQFYKSVAQDTNIILGKNVTIDGKYNFVTGNKVKIQGDQNTVLSNDAIILGSNNNVITGLNGIKIIADGTTPTNTNVSTGEKVFLARINQAGTAAPTLIIYRNDFGGTITTSRATVGRYTILGFNSQLTTPTVISMNFNGLVNPDYFVSSVLSTNSLISIRSYNASVLSDDVMTGAELYIQITTY